MPTVACVSSPTQRLSHIIGIILQPCEKYEKLYTRNSTNVLRKLPQRIDKNTRMITCDVENLYNNISHVLGRKAICWTNIHNSLEG